MLLKLCAAFLTSEVGAQSASVVAESGTVRVVARVGSATDSSVMYGRPWRPNQRIMLVMQDTTVDMPGDSVKGQVYARDEYNTPVSRPQFIWGLNNVAIFTGRTTIDNEITLVGRTGLYYNRNTLSVEWGVWRDSVIVVTGIPQTSVLPPFTTIRLDTVNIYTNPTTGLLRNGILKVDSSGYFATSVDRIDDRYNRTPFRVWIHDSYRYAYSDSASLQGAVVMSPMSCPLKTGWDAPMWDMRWAPPDTSKDPNIVAPIKLAKAAAAQLPLDALRDMAKVSMERYLFRDPQWVLGQHIYKECFGTQ